MHSTNQTIASHRRVFIIGCGGVGSWLVPALARLVSPEQITLIDGDTLEPKNLDRQLFSNDDIGRNKAEALAERYNTEFIPEYFSSGSISPAPRDILIVAVDNDPARKAALDTADMFGCSVIIGANEYTDAEAYFYQPEWKGTPRDPRVYYPNILTNREDDPTAATTGCTGEAATLSPQLVAANYWAAGFILHLFVFHEASLHGERPFSQQYDEKFHPLQHRVTFARHTTLRGLDRPIEAAEPVAA